MREMRTGMPLSLIHIFYMTATPRYYNDNAKATAKDKDLVLWSMNNPDYYGEEFFRIGFGRAVREGLLTDYKV